MPFNYTDSSSTNLYAVYSWPNAVLALMGGFIVDKITGVRGGAFLFGALILIGQTIFAIGITSKIYGLAVFGRFVFGCGGESLTVVQNTFTARWFDGKRMALAFGIIVAFSRIGTAVNFLLTPTFTSLGVPFALWIGTEMCMMSFLAVGFVSLLDWYGEAAVRVRQERQGLEKDPEVSLHQIRHFPFMAWLIFFNCVFFYISVLVFYVVASKILQKVAGYSSVDASSLIAIPNFVAIVAAPFFGWMVDRLGRSVYWLGLGCVMQVIAHVFMLGHATGSYSVPPAFIMVWIGIGYSLYAASIWPMLPFIIKSEMLGTAYGMMTSIQNFGLALFELIVGYIMDPYPDREPKKYVYPIILFIICAGISFVLTIILFVVDLRRDGVLNSQGAKKQEYKEWLNSGGQQHRAGDLK
eukprot:TRINITY_DN2915_c0_g1_i7.p1 TRINITY_DN2915_c0_g1~~TRINITY_DN2915_c0_g1_i7.p1  ORF type:complete len:410 (+),score=32.05 TRINITY_DN2915_c0_g1_i7:206-1435(+)